MPTGKIGRCYIYKIEQIDNGEMCYVGRASQLRNRELAHRRDCVNERGRQYYKYIYCHIRDHGGWDNFTFTQIDFKEGLTILEKQKLEQEWIDKLNPILNQVRAYNSEEYRAIMRADRIQRSREYYQQRKQLLNS